MKNIVSVKWPRQRLLLFGAEVLNDTELLTVLLQRGNLGSSAADRALKLLEEDRGLASLLDFDAATLRGMGLGAAVVSTLLASVELGRRLAHPKFPERRKLPPREQLAEYLIQRYAASEQEICGVFFLNARGGLIAEREMFRGSRQRISVDLGPILKQALLLGARSLVVFHTHPGGDPLPSTLDQIFTRDLGVACASLGLRLVDHMVVSLGGWASILRGRKS